MEAALQHLPNDLRGLPISRQQFFALLPLGLDPVILVQQIAEELFLVQFADKAILDDILAVVDEKVHDGLGHLIGNGFTNDVEVGGDEAADELRFKSFTLGEGRFRGVGRGLSWGQPCTVGESGAGLT